MEIAQLGCLEVPEILDFGGPGGPGGPGLPGGPGIPGGPNFDPGPAGPGPGPVSGPIGTFLPPGSFYHRALFNNQVHIFPLE